MSDEQNPPREMTIDYLMGDDQPQQETVTMFQRDDQPQQETVTMFQRDENADFPKYNVRPPPPSKRGKQNTTQAHFQNGRSYDGFDLKQPHEIISNPSGAPLSDYRLNKRSSVATRGNNRFMAFLLKWSRVLSKERNNLIHTSIKTNMKDVETAVFFCSQNYTFLYIEIPKGATRGLFQCGRRGKGTNCISKAEGPTTWNSHVNPNTINQELTQFLIEQNWDVSIQGDFRRGQEIIKELLQKNHDEVGSRKREDKEFTKAVQSASKEGEKVAAERILWEKIKRDYTNMLLTSNATPAEWFNKQYPAGDPQSNVARRLLYTGGRFEYLVKAYNTARKLNEPVAQYKTPQETLKKYVNENGSAVSMLKCLQIVNNAGHGRLIRAACTLLLGQATKQRTVWATGVANSGKSRFLRHLREIFGSEEVDWRGQYLTQVTRYNPEIKIQLVTCEEFAFKNAFSKENRHVTKMLFEGEGANVRPDLYAQFGINYEGAAFFVASNTLPGTEAQASDEDFNGDVWGPIASRVHFVHMTVKHSSDEEFPYTGVQLARALLFLEKNKDLMEKMSILDGKTIPAETPVSDCARWHKELAVQQMGLFATLLTNKESSEDEEGSEREEEEGSVSEEEEVKLEEIFTQAQRDGNMGLIGDQGGSQRTTKGKKIMSQCVIVKKKEF